MQPNEQELSRMMNEDELRNVPLLVLVNKADLENSMPLHEVITALNVPSIKDRKIHVAP